MKPKRGVQVRVEVPAGLRVLADRTRLQQVLANLLDNAVKCSRPGGEVRVVVEAHGGRVEVASRPGEGSTFPVVLPAVTVSLDSRHQRGA